MEATSAQMPRPKDNSSAKSVDIWLDTASSLIPFSKNDNSRRPFGRRECRVDQVRSSPRWEILNLEQVFVNGSCATSNTHANVADINKCAFDQALPNESLLSFGVCQAHVLLSILFLNSFHTSFQTVNTC